ncbi:PQQ-binding-like beta-propeller repeat protein [bacterium]|nr:PQQ-binding-like beta-propeller repeat protein [bacterium]
MTRMRLTSLMALVFCGLVSQSPAQSSTEASVAGLRLPVDRSSQERYQTALRALEQGQMAEALVWLERLRNDALVATTDGAVAGNVLAERLIEQATPTQQTLLRTGSDTQAQQVWNDWQASPSLDGLKAYLWRYGSTEAGVRAWCRLGAWLMDEREFQQAEMVWQHVLRHPRGGQSAKDLADRCLQACQMAITTQAEPSVGKNIPTAELTRPGLRPFSEHSLSLPPLLQDSWRNWLSEMEAQGTVPWSAAQPLIVGNRVIVRHSLGYAVLDGTSLKPLWQLSLENWDWLQNNPGYLENNGFRQTLFDQFGRKRLSDGLMHGASSDGRQLFVILPRKESLEQSTPLGAFPNQQARDGQLAPLNYLAAYDLSTGQLNWRVGGESAGPTYPFGDVYFCSLPCVVDDLAFVLGQQKTELLLFAIRIKHGDLVWKLTLGDAPRTLAADPARQRINCQPTWHDGLLYCPTATGAMFAINVVTQSVDWVYRYELSSRERVQAGRTENTSFLRDDWWTGWKRPQLQFQGAVAVLTSPESDELHGIEAHSGRLLWKQPRGQGLVTFPGLAGQILVQEKSAVRAYDCLTGQQTWRTVLDEFLGHGAIVGESIVLPIKEGACQAVRLQDGVALAVDWPGRDLGHLQPFGKYWLSTSFDALTLWPDMTEDEPAAVAKTTDSTEKPWDTACRQFSLGQWAAASKTLSGQNAIDAAELSRLMAREHLRQQTTQHQTLPTGSHAVTEPAIQMLEDQLMEAQNLLIQGRQDEAVSLLLQTIQSAPRRGAIRFAGPQRWVRPDLAAVGLLTSLWEQTGRASGSVEQQLKQHWQKSAASSDPFALPKLVDTCQPMAWTDELLVAGGDAAFLGQPLQARELRLLKAAQTVSAPENVAIWDELVRQMQQAGFEQDAADYRRVAHPKTAMLSQRTWPERPVEIERKKEKNDNVHYFPVPLDLSSTPFFDRLDVSIERMGRRVRLAGAGLAGSWEIALPPSPSPFRHLQQHVNGWGRGRVLVLRVGFELFGLAPVDDRGDPAAKVLWHLDCLSGTTLSPDQLRLDVIPAVPGIRDEEYRVIDPFGRVVAQVGPVCPDYLCYTDKGQLISIDLATGLRRWVRSDLDPGTTVTGNGEYVFLCTPALERIECLRACDGSTLSVSKFSLDLSHTLRLSDGLIWTLSSTQPAKLSCQRLLDQQVVWEQHLSLGSAVAFLDDQHLAWIETNGNLTILDGDLGTQRATLSLRDVPADMDRVVASRDGDLWFLAVSTRVPQQAGLQLQQLRSGYRAAFMTGTLAAIDRNAPRVLWQRTLDREPVAADQPRAVPVLIQNYKLPSPDLQAGQMTDGQVRLIDKYSGAVLFDHRSPDLLGYAALTADRHRGVIHLALQHETVQLWYAPRPPAPALPDEP